MKKLGIVLLVVVLHFSCASRKEGHYSKEVVRIDSLHIMRRDSLSFRNILKSVSGQHLQVKHIAFSRPDSLSAQYIQSVTLLESIYQDERMEENIEEADHLQTISHEQQLKIEEEGAFETKRSSFTLKYIVGCSVLLLLLIPFLYKLRR